ncbi:DUF2262 domain-containing protein [Psychrobacillus lasiicapitis]|uniref:DUF2262 domain-containing protein n=1 Tax=Psychrobacillus lasiicapitis TaxID=1636719 RepID=A0A544T4N1_9BACI|nr:DUF2262 domain-containing protein [Psychrobacillus lasiicapitis]TQR12408.1 DUF2262 domain-containing protein [Psychrobacillus lasiicapitis]GGA37850.1 hypothetical protein GCM10011384_29240 [Psychrobacillus lasiicapitis]
MEKIIRSELIGVFTYNEDTKTFEASKGKIHWQLNIIDELVNQNEMLKRAEALFLVLEEFNRKAKTAIAEKLINHKNDFWPEYDEDDENLNWDAVDAGEYDVTKEEFAEAISLYDIEIREKDIYCEYNDGNLFGGHRIHAHFDNDYKLLNTEV